MNDQIDKAGGRDFIGGMGAMAPMKRSATVVTDAAFRGAGRVHARWSDCLLDARHEQHLGPCAQALFIEAQGGIR